MPTNINAVLWLHASSHEEIINDFTILAQLLQLPERNAQDSRQIVMATKHWLQTNPGWLLIVDNADEIDMVQPYLPSATSGHILLTTRAQAIRGIAQKIELPLLSLNEGILFLLRRAGLIAVEASSLDDVPSTDLTVAEAIVKGLNRLPLALDQAGAYIEETKESLSDYLALYQDYRKELLARRGRLVQDHGPVVTTWSLAFEKIATNNPAAIDLLYLCAFLAPDTIAEEMLIQGAKYVSLELQQAAKSKLQWNQLIEDLHAYSLLDRQAITHTLSLHRLVQAVIRDALGSSEQQMWIGRAIQVITNVFPQYEPAPWSKSQRYALDALTCLVQLSGNSERGYGRRDRVKVAGTFRKVATDKL